MSDMTHLFTPYEMGPYKLPNRLVMAPMTRSRAGEHNAPTALTAEYYAQRAGAAFIVTEASQISPQAVGYPGTPGIHSDAQIEGWRAVTDAVHANGGRIYLQLWHVGRISHSSLQPDGQRPVAPSAIAADGELFTASGLQAFEQPRALALEELSGIVDQFRQAAAYAQRAGFDGVEIHGANGYLIDQFLRDGSNQRTDAYGGAVENRVRLLLEITDAVVEVWGAERVGVRLSPSATFNSMSDSNPQALFEAAVRAMSARNVGYLHLIEPGPDAQEAGPNAEKLTVKHFRPMFQNTLIASTGYTRESGERAIANGDADLIAYGTAFLANPDLPERFRLEAPLNDPNPDTFYGGGAAGYTDYPSLASLETPVSA